MPDLHRIGFRGLFWANKRQRQDPIIPELMLFLRDVQKVDPSDRFCSNLWRRVEERLYNPFVDRNLGTTRLANEFAFADLPLITHMYRQRKIGAGAQRALEQVYKCLSHVSLTEISSSLVTELRL